MYMPSRKVNISATAEVVEDVSPITTTTTPATSAPSPFSLETLIDTLTGESSPPKLPSSLPFLEPERYKFMQQMRDTTPVNPKPEYNQQQNMLEVIGKLGTTVARPYNAVAVGLYNVAKEMHNAKLNKSLTAGERTYNLVKAYYDGFYDGWDFKDNKNLMDVAEIGTLGPETIQKVEKYLQDKPELKFARDAGKFIGSELIENLCENIVGMGLMASIGKTSKYFPKAADFVHEMKLGKVYGQGFNKFAQEAAEMAAKNAPVKYGDELLDIVDSNIIRKLTKQMPDGKHIIQVGDRQFHISIGQQGDELSAFLIPDEKQLKAYEALKAKKLSIDKRLADNLNKADDIFSKQVRIDTTLEKGTKVAKSNILTSKKRGLGEFNFSKITEDLVEKIKVQDTLDRKIDNLMSKMDEGWNIQKVEKLNDQLSINSNEIARLKNQIDTVAKNKIDIDTIIPVDDIKTKVNIQTAYDTKITKLWEQKKDLDKIYESLHLQQLEHIDNIAQMKKGIFYDHKTLQEAVRKDYLAKLIEYKSYETKLDPSGNQIKVYTSDFNDKVKEFTSALTMGQTENIEELTDKEFMGLFDFAEVYAKTPKEFKEDGLLDLLLSTKTNTPAWTWYSNHGVPEIPAAIDTGHRNSIIRMLRTRDELERIFAPWGGAKAFKDDALQQRIFLLANGLSESGINRGDFEKYGKLATEAKLTLAQMNAEQIAANSCNDMFKNIPAELMANRQWKEGLKVEQFYMRNQLKEVVKDVDTLNSTNSLMFYGRANRPVNIPELMNRVLNDDPLIENAYSAVMTSMRHSVFKIEMEPAIMKATTLANATGNADIIGYTNGTKYHPGFINVAVRGNSSAGEKYFAEPLAQGLNKAIERSAKLIGKTIDMSNITHRHYLTAIRTTNIVTALGFNPKTNVKQFAQGLMNIPLSGYRSYLKGAESLFDANGAQFAAKHCSVLLDRTPLETAELFSFHGLTDASLKLMGDIDTYHNITIGFNAAVDRTIKNSPEARRIIQRYSHNKSFNSISTNEFYTAVGRAFDNGELLWVKKIAETDSKVAQYSYNRYDMPRLLWGPVGKTVFQFTSWPANYFYSYLPTLIKSARTGLGPSGEVLSASQRWGLLKAAVNGYTIYALGREIGVDATWALSSLPPIYPNIDNIRKDEGSLFEIPFFSKNGKLKPTLGGAFPQDYPPLFNVGLGLATLGVGFMRGSINIINEGMRYIDRGSPALSQYEVNGAIDWPWNKDQITIHRGTGLRKFSIPDEGTTKFFAPGTSATSIMLKAIKEKDRKKIIPGLLFTPLRKD